MAPALALCCGPGAQRLARYAHSRAVVAAALVAVLPAAGLACFYVSAAGPALARRLLYPNPLYEDLAVGRWLGQASAPQESLYVYGSEPQIYVYAGRRCATATTFAYPLTLMHARPGRIDAELRALREARPAFVVYSRQPLSTLISGPEGWRFRDEVRRCAAAGLPAGQLHNFVEGAGWTRPRRAGQLGKCPVFHLAAYYVPDDTCGLYRTWIQIPQSWQRPASLRGVRRRADGAEIWLNGQPVLVNEPSWASPISMKAPGPASRWT